MNWKKKELAMILTRIKSNTLKRKLGKVNNLILLIKDVIEILMLM